MSQIVEAAGYLRGLARSFPGDFPTVHRLPGDIFIGALLWVVPRETVLLVRKNIVLRLGSGEKAAPVRQDGHGAGV